MIDAVRWWIALLILVATPPAFVTWFVIHPFAGFWRRHGGYAAYLAALAVGLPLGYGLFRLRHRLLAVDLGTSWVLVALGVGCAAVAVGMAVQVRRQLSVATQMGLPEVAPDRHPGALLTEGIYARVRHPRYVEALLGLFGWALIANYAAVYVLMALMLPALHAIVVLEERELRERFGAAYEAYARQVPRYVPRLRPGRGGG